MSAIDAAGTTFTFDGTTVGGIESYEFLRGEARVIKFRPVAASAAIALPGQPDFDRCVLKLNRDFSDAGQAKLQNSLRMRQVRTCVVTYKDGTTNTFNAFCILLPVVGSKGMATPVNLTTCQLQISGPIT